MELWQIVIVGGAGFIFGFWTGAWVQRQEEPKSAAELSLERKIVEKSLNGDL